MFGIRIHYFLKAFFAFKYPNESNDFYNVEIRTSKEGKEVIKNQYDRRQRFYKNIHVGFG